MILGAQQTQSYKMITSKPQNDNTRDVMIVNGRRIYVSWLRFSLFNVIFMFLCLKNVLSLQLQDYYQHNFQISL